MSDSTVNVSPRPVSLFTVFALFVGFALFLLLVYKIYVPRQMGAFTDDGIHTAVQRGKNLAELRAKQSAQAASYAWVDKKTGVVQLPIERAIDLTVQQYGPKK